jgi:ubiquinone/menaquinone biosynthesis C-methylase UbiE
MSTDTVHHPIFARAWTWLSVRCDDAGAREHRREMLDGSRGRGLEIGAGNGRNFPHYSTAVESVVAIEPEAYLRERAREAAASASVPVEVVDATAAPLPFGDGSFDFAVTSLVLCTVPDQPLALAELRRVLRDGGELRFYEHVAPRAQPKATLFSLADRSGVYPRLTGGCHCFRDTAATIEAAGFAIERMRRFTFNGSPHVLGVARR